MSTSKLPARPAAALLAAALLLGGAAVLLLAWLLRVDDVASNGARVFFVVLWTYLAWAVYQGGGWVRIAILAVFVVTAWGAFNAPSATQALQAMPAGDQLARLLAFVALAAMLSPSAHRWFAAAKHADDEVAE